MESTARIDNRVEPRVVHRPQRDRPVSEERSVTKLDRTLWCVLFGVGLIGFLTVLFFAVLAYIPSRTVTVPYRAGFLILSLAVIGIAFIRNQKFYEGWLWWPLLFFFFSYSLRIIYDGYLSHAFLPMPPNELLLMAFGACLIPSIAFMRRMPLNAAWAGFWGFITVGVGGALMSSFLYRDLFAGEVGRLRGGAFVGEYVGISPLGIAYMGSALTVVGLALLVLPKSYSLIYRRILPLVLAGVGVYPMMIGASRGPLIAIIVCSLLLFVARLRERQMKNALFVGIVLCGLGAGFVLVAQEIGSVAVDRFIGIRTDIAAGTGAAARLYIWESAVRGFLSSPLLGASLTVPGQVHPHNFIVEAFLATGVLGGTCFTILLIAGIRRSFRILRHYPEYGWIAILFVHYAVNGMFSSSIGTLPAFWYTFGAVLGVTAVLGLEKKRNRKMPSARRVIEPA